MRRIGVALIAAAAAGCLSDDYTGSKCENNRCDAVPGYACEVLSQTCRRVGSGTGGGGGGVDGGVGGGGVGGGGVGGGGMGGGGMGGGMGGGVGGDGGVCDPLPSAGIALPGGIRLSHAAQLLGGCRVLLTGGTSNGALSMGDSWMYDGRSNGWFDAGMMTLPRFNHPMALLVDGGVWAIGGSGTNSILSATERYSGSGWMPGPPMAIARTRHTATVLASGRVVVLGGYNSGDQGIALGESCCSVAGTWVDAGTLVQGRNRHTATLLPNGKILVVGGSPFININQGAKLGSAELYDPVTGTSVDAGFLAVPRVHHVALPAPGGVLVLGGFDNNDIGTPIVEWYDLATGAWQCRAPLKIGRAQFAATMINPTTAMIAGGDMSPGMSAESTVELYSLGGEVPCLPDAGSTSILAAPMNGPRSRPTVTLLPNDLVLTTGSTSVAQPGSELYRPATNTWLPVP